jgi:hypothetical protein
MELFMNKINEVAYFSFAKLLLPKQRTDYPLPFEYVPTTTARSAFYLIVTYLKSKNIITSKNDQILFPQWICVSMAQCARKYLSPTLNSKANIKFALAYHQYGFPQDMDEVMDFADRKKIIVIEDCANHIKGKYKGKDLGTFGMAGIYSTSKIFPTLWGGGVGSTDIELIEYARKAGSDLNRNYINYYLMFMRYLSNLGIKTELTYDLNLMAYAVAERGLRQPKSMLNIMYHELNNQIYDKRFINYQKIRRELSSYDFFPGLEDHDVFPYVVPLFAADNLLNSIATKLTENKIWTGIYNFDVNRNIFNPDFKKCVLLPVHQGLSDIELDKIITSVREAVK